MSSNYLKIKKNGIKEFKLCSDEEKVSCDKKINFVYGNNGVGKTIITEYLRNCHSDKCIFFSNEINTYDASSFTFKPKQNEINKLETSIFKIFEKLMME